MWVLTSLTEGPEFEAIRKFSAPIEDLNSVGLTARIVRRYGPPADDVRLVPRHGEQAILDERRAAWMAAGSISPDQTGSYIYRFWFLDRSFFSAAPLQLQDAGAPQVPYMPMVFAANNFVDQQGPRFTFWYLDIGWQPQASKLYVHDIGLADNASLGSVMQPDTFYQALAAKIDGSCCR